MKLQWALVTALAFLCTPSMTLAQPTYVSGLLHTALGTAQLDPPTDRRLPVRNLGSSGEDGVEIQLHSVLGGGAEVDLEPFLSTPGATLRHKHKGWDGLIYGNHRLVSNGDGTALLTCDYSEVGATEITIQRRGANGNVVSSDTYPGPIVDLPLNHQIFDCPPGSIAVAGVWVGQLCNTCPIITVYVFYCDGVMYTEALVITPTFPTGTPDNPGVESLSITGSGLPELVISDADIRTFGVPSWGLGQAHLSEQCTPDSMGGCDETDRRLVVTNIGSSGQDGVAIDLPGNNGGATASVAKGNCCRGHVIIMKLYDDEGQEQRVMMTQTTDSSGTEELDADFSALGAAGYILTAYDAGGGVVGPPEGTAIISGGPKVLVVNPCPPGTKAIYENIGTTTNPVWKIIGCLGFPMDLVVPGVGVLTGVASFQIEPLNATSGFGRAARLEMLSDDPEGLILDDLAVAPALLGDTNCDGVISYGDINPFVVSLGGRSAYEAQYPGCHWMNADCDNNGAVNYGDINAFVLRLSNP